MVGCVMIEQMGECNIHTNKYVQVWWIELDKMLAESCTNLFNDS